MPMYTYEIRQWLIFFYIYCFLGWCFESAYVSIKERKFVNRGFMVGPFLPIYGSGAICVLIASLPLRQWPIAVYFGGAFAATALELVTGILMEALFKVRYWDYTPKPFNFKGYICLGSSITWGFFSLGMVYGFHKPIERFVLMFSDNVTSVVAIVLTVYISADFASSFKTAMNLREVLIKAQQVLDEVRVMQKRIEVMETFKRDDLQKKAKTVLEKNPKLLEYLEDIQERIEDMKQALPVERLEQFKEELGGFKEKTIIFKSRLNWQFSRDKINLLKRNPSAKSKDYQHILDEIKEAEKLYK
jgi:uncharacterized membrane protein